MLKKKLFRDLWHYKGQFFTIFLMVFIGMLAFSGIHGYMDGMDESAKEYYKEYPTIFAGFMDHKYKCFGFGFREIKVYGSYKRCKSCIGFECEIKGV